MWNPNLNLPSLEEEDLLSGVGVVVLLDNCLQLLTAGGVVAADDRADQAVTAATPPVSVTVHLICQSHTSCHRDTKQS